MRISAASLEDFHQASTFSSSAVPLEEHTAPDRSSSGPRQKISASSFGDFQLHKPRHDSETIHEASEAQSLGVPQRASIVEQAENTSKPSHKLSAASFGDFRTTATATPHIGLREVLHSDTSSATNSDHQPYSSGAAGGQTLPKWRFMCLSLCLSIGLFLSFLDGSITATALYTIGGDFDDALKVTWIAAGYTLADVAFAVIFAAVSDIIGRFYAYLVAQAIFFAFSIACGFASDLNQLIAFRVFQGIGGSGLYSLAMIIWPEMSTLALKQWIGAFVGLVVAAAGVAGPLLGGVITHDISWRWIFWINPPILVVSTALFVVSWPRSNRIRKHEAVDFRSLDIKGASFLAAGSVLPVLAFEQAASQSSHAWSRGSFIGPLAAGVASWFLLAAWEFYVTRWRTRTNPIFPPSLLKNRRYAANAANSLLIGFCFFVAIYFVPLHLQIVNAKSSLGAATSLLPMLGAAAFGSFLAGALSSGIDLLCPSITAGSALMVLGTGLLSTISESQAVEKKIYGFQVLVGLGFGLTVSASSIVANVECELKDHAVAQGVVAQARVLGGSFGIAAGTAMLGRRVHALAGVVTVTEMQSLFAVTAQLDAEQKGAVRHAYNDAFRWTMRIAAIVSGVAFLAALAIYDNSKIPLPHRVVLQEQREDERIAKLMQERRRLQRAEQVLEQQEKAVVRSGSGSESGGLVSPPPPPTYQAAVREVETA